MMRMIPHLIFLTILEEIHILEEKEMTIFLLNLIGQQEKNINHGLIIKLGQEYDIHIQ